MFKNFEKINNQGVTLLEIMIAISVFSVVVIAAIGLFVSLIKNQKALLDKAYVLNTLSYSTEYIAKALRMAQKDLNGSCIGVKKNFESQNSSHIKFLNYNNECQEFWLENNVLKVRKLNLTHNLTPDNIIVEGLSFVLTGESQDDFLQPKISFSIKAKPSISTYPSLFIQTTVSQRMLDVSY